MEDVEGTEVGDGGDSHTEARRHGEKAGRTSPSFPFQGRIPDGRTRGSAPTMQEVLFILRALRGFA